MDHVPHELLVPATGVSSHMGFALQMLVRPWQKPFLLRYVLRLRATSDGYLHVGVLCLQRS